MFLSSVSQEQSHCKWHGFKAENLETNAVAKQQTLETTLVNGVSYQVAQTNIFVIPAEEDSRFTIHDTN